MTKKVYMFNDSNGATHIYASSTTWNQITNAASAADGVYAVVAKNDWKSVTDKRNKRTIVRCTKGLISFLNNKPRVVLAKSVNDVPSGYRKRDADRYFSLGASIEDGTIQTNLTRWWNYYMEAKTDKFSVEMTKEDSDELEYYRKLNKQIN